MTLCSCSAVAGLNWTKPGRTRGPEQEAGRALLHLREAITRVARRTRRRARTCEISNEPVRDSQAGSLPCIVWRRSGDSWGGGPRGNIEEEAGRIVILSGGTLHGRCSWLIATIGWDNILQRVTQTWWFFWSSQAELRLHSPKTQEVYFTWPEVSGKWKYWREPTHGLDHKHEHMGSGNVTECRYEHIRLCELEQLFLLFYWPDF